MSEKLEKLEQKWQKAEKQLTAAKHKEKYLEHEMKRLNRKERTHRLCTRAGMLEVFLHEPTILTDDDVMELLTFLFHGEAAQKKLNLLIEERKKTLETEVAGNPCRRQGRNYTPPKDGALRPAGSPLHGADDLCVQRAKRICLHIHLAAVAATGRYAGVTISCSNHPEKVTLPLRWLCQLPFIAPSSRSDYFCLTSFLKTDSFIRKFIRV